MKLTGQFFLVILFSVLNSIFFSSNLLGVIATITVPLTFFYPYLSLSLALSLLIATLLTLILRSSKKNPSWVSLFAVLIVIFVSYFLIKPHLFANISSPAVIDAQRGEHVDYQNNIIAKLLHNKASNAVYYLDNLVNQISPSVIFASGHFPNFSKYIPIGYLVPWYLIFFLISLKKNIKDYVKPAFLLTLALIFFFISISTGAFSWLLVSSLLWFIVLQSSFVIAKLDRRYSLGIITFNLLYLFLYVLPINNALYSSLLFL